MSPLSRFLPNTLGLEPTPSSFLGVPTRLSLPLLGVAFTSPLPGRAEILPFPLFSFPLRSPCPKPPLLFPLSGRVLTLLSLPSLPTGPRLILPCTAFLGAALALELPLLGLGL